MSRVPIIVVHGGAGANSLIVQDGIPQSEVEGGVARAAKTGHAVLTAGGTAVDAVEAAVASMEDNPVFNAGRGSCLTTAGTVEMDASIMDGKNLATGGVTCIEGVANPVTVARIVMEKTPHVLLAGSGARDFAQQNGAKMATVEELLTEKALGQLKNFPVFDPATKAEFYEKIKDNQTGIDPKDHDTVGAVAMDTKGHVAYATSTGGITAKMPGRVGDTPMVGCGGYADDVSGAVSTTGHGESIVKVTLARHVNFLMEKGISAQEAVEHSLQYLKDKVGGQAGCVAVDSQGGAGVHWTTVGMSWATIKEDRLQYGVYKDQTHTEKL